MKLEPGFTQFTMRIEHHDEMEALLIALRQFDAGNGAGPYTQSAREMYEQIDRLRAKVSELKQMLT